MDEIGKITVSICFFTSSIQEIFDFEVPAGTTVNQALDASGIKQKHQQIDFSQFSIGVFGKIVDQTYVLNEYDRIEIYQPLIVDPMQARRERANFQD